jgi:hypothetical protein
MRHLPRSTDLAGLQFAAPGISAASILWLKRSRSLLLRLIRRYLSLKKEEGLVLSFSCFGDPRCAEPIKNGSGGFVLMLHGFHFF